MDLLVKRVPVGRIGRGSEIARAVEFLVADEASYVTGSIISVNGGLDM
jgi:NAD(P)-dependent dehydrogenase (short-subunit alcohol dehydrogenase family)